MSSLRPTGSSNDPCNQMKRAFDVGVSMVGLIVASPVLLPAIIMVWWSDKAPPFYIAERIGKGGEPFRMVKLRTMTVGADRSGVDSTGSSDPRITRLGHFLRRFKIDELPQLWNVLRGDMSVVGPRPNVRRETELYTREELQLLMVKPGMTGLASIVFADEGEILNDEADPDLAYGQLIRPRKSALGLFYISRRSLLVDIALCWWTGVGILSRPAALKGLQGLLRRLGASEEIAGMAARKEPLAPIPPPGATRVVASRRRGLGHGPNRPIGWKGPRK